MMAMNDPLGDMLTRIRNAQMRSKSRCPTPGFEAARAACSKCSRRKAISAAIRHRIRHGRSEIEIELKYFDGAAGDPRDRAGVEAGPPRLCRGRGHAARSTTASA